MKFLVDQQLPLALARRISTQAHDAVHVRELGLERAEDLDIWREARIQGATIVSKDADFAGIARIQPGHPPVVWVRFGNCTNDALIQRFASVWPQVMSELESGAALVELR